MTNGNFKTKPIAVPVTKEEFVSNKVRPYFKNKQELVKWKT